MSDAQLLLPGGGIRDDKDAIARVASALRADAAVTALVDEIGDSPAARGAFGLLFPATLRSSGEGVLIKVNANAYERAWMRAIHDVDPEVGPAVHGSGEVIGDLRVTWLALERLPYQPPGFGGPEWYAPLMRAAFRWQDAAATIDLEPVHAIGDQLVRTWIDDAISLDGTRELHQLRNRFDDDWAWIDASCPMQVSHGDVHFFNAGSRTDGIPETLVLFDPIPRLAPWPYDVANCHVLTNYAGDVPLVAFAAAHRRAKGLPTPADPDVDRISALWCAWLAVMWRVLFREVQPGRRESAAAYVERAFLTG
jgi:hypothetical protein